MAADDAAKAAAKNPQATVAQNMGVLPTANVDVPSKSDSYIPAITGRLGNPINGSLSMSGFNFNSNDPYSKFYSLNLKAVVTSPTRRPLQLRRHRPQYPA